MKTNNIYIIIGLISYKLFANNQYKLKLMIQSANTFNMDVLLFNLIKIWHIPVNFEIKARALCVLCHSYVDLFFSPTSRVKIR
jgi:hypothetical protein